ncbi:MAG: hypothetical protein M1834_008729 [Cirrosporium novae-zelandiae]|nr:MAG: hypothetical protein M1834_008729 [Cirrosporium novae-zelandiae]
MSHGLNQILNLATLELFDPRIKVTGHVIIVNGEWSKIAPLKVRFNSSGPKSFNIDLKVAYEVRDVASTCNVITKEPPHFVKHPVVT